MIPFTQLSVLSVVACPLISAFTAMLTVKIIKSFGG
nr:MAG TPA: hypothetical protein [Inoviridae sp.]